MAGRGVWTAIGAVLFAGAGFGLGAFGAALNARNGYIEPWAKMTVESEGASGKPNHTRVIFKNPKLPLQAIEVFSTADGAPTLAHVSLREGDELAIEYDEKNRPASLTSSDGTRATLGYEDDRTRVTFYAPDGSEVGTKRVVVPIQLLAEAEVESNDPHAESKSKLAALSEELRWQRISDLLMPAAHAAEAEDEDITVTRELPLTLDVKTSGTDSDKPAAAQIDSSCPPFGCAPSKHQITVPGSSDASITVTGTVKKSALKAPAAGQIDAFDDEARAERKAATHALPEVARVIGAVGVTAMACKSLALTSPLCVKELGSNAGVAGGAVTGVLHDVVESDSSIIDARANQLFYEEEARAQLDKDTPIEVCVSRDGFARICTTIPSKPFGSNAMAKVSRSVELRRGVGGTLLGSFAMTQADGSDCKFSPSPKTTGELRLTFDNDKNTVSASLTSNDRGSRPNMGCSLGTANMTWSQSYTVTATETFTKEQLGHGGKLPLALTGSMNGSGSYSFSNCRTGDGASASCPPGKSDGYNYTVQLNGSIDLDSHVGSGAVIVTNAPLVTSGTWRIPAEPKP